MGAELIGYLLRGPSTFTSEALREARQHARRMKVCGDLVATLSDEDELESLLLSGITEEELELVRHMLFDELLDAEEVVEHMHQAEKHLEAFVYFWEKKWSRDSMFRSIEDGAVIVFAGESTWGDQPTGVGYESIKFAEYLGFLKRLGVS